jgi:hypothetical protein
MSGDTSRRYSDAPETFPQLAVKEVDAMLDAAFAVGGPTPPGSDKIVASAFAEMRILLEEPAVFATDPTIKNMSIANIYLIFI